MFEKEGWIWYENCGYDDVNVYMLARKDFALMKSPEGIVEINITADSRYKLYVNGEYICYGPARGYPESYPVDTVDISKYLRRGKNVIAVVVHQYGHGTFQSIYGGAAGLIVEGRIGSIDIGTSRENGWLVKKCPGHKQDMIRRTVQMGYQENYDAREPEIEWMLPEGIIESGKNGWSKPNWRKAGCAPWRSFEERGIPMLKEEEAGFRQVIQCFYGKNSNDWQYTRNLTSVYLKEKKTEHKDKSYIKGLENMLKPDETSTTIMPFPLDKHITFIVDAGIEIVGFLGIETEGSGGEVIDLTTAELLDDKGHLYINDPEIGSKVAVSDRYIMRKGNQKFETFSIHGFRYLAMTLRNVRKPLKIKRLYIRETAYPFKNRTVFETSDEGLNRIWDMCIRTQICCSLDSYVDCPWREQAQWWGDARIQAANTYYAFGDMRLFRRGVKQAGQSQISNGLTYGHFPTIAVGCILPDFTMTWIHTHLDYYRYTGDISLMKEQYNRIEKAIGFFDAYINGNYLLGNMPEYWVFLDWAPLYKDGFSCLFNLMYLSTLRTVAGISRILKKYEKEKQYIKMADDLEKKIKKVFWDKNRKVFWDGYDTAKKIPVKKLSQHTHSWAILLNINRKYHRLWTEEILLPPMRLKPLTHQEIIEASPFFYFYVIESLKKVGGYEREIIDFIRKRWGMMLDSGATTCWEIWLPKPGWSSFCHAWSAHPIVHFIELIGGIMPVRHNWKEIKKLPSTYKINSAKLLIPTVSGNIRVEVRNGTVKLKADPSIKVIT
ncbi:MAG: family 78 glycoside hydrolase catalytic domain [Candidatus Omnitrophica bacterium]|nr:family 78 glycoside hydrolase catalytic domain [Candidatus Omnitrophota bacterium]